MKLSQTSCLTKETIHVTDIWTSRLVLLSFLLSIWFDWEHIPKTRHILYQMSCKLAEINQFQLFNSYLGVIRTACKFSEILGAFPIRPNIPGVFKRGQIARNF